MSNHNNALQAQHSTVSVGLIGISHYDNQRQFIQHHIMELSLLMSRVQYNTGYTTTCPEIVCAMATHFATCTVQHQFNTSTFYRYLANTLSMQRMPEEWTTANYHLPPWSGTLWPTCKISPWHLSCLIHLWIFFSYKLICQFCGSLQL